MLRSRSWRVYAQHECLYLCGPVYSGDYIIAAMNLGRCPKCGDSCGLHARDTWARVVRRRVSDARILHPSTWGRWHWEYRHRGHLETGGFDYRGAMRNAQST